MPLRIENPNPTTCVLVLNLVARETAHGPDGGIVAVRCALVVCHVRLAAGGVNVAVLAA